MQKINPFISICIPAYKRVDYLKRLLDSIAGQTFQDFEIILSDDSDDLSVYNISEQYKEKLPIHYYKNVNALGTPANWNAAVAMAKGEWIKIMHDDDWFTSPQSLKAFADHTQQNKKMIFSAYTNCFEDSTGRKEDVYMPSSWKKKILREPNILLAYNVIGPPSVTMLHKSVNLVYDERLKWRVDMEYYIRVLQQEREYIYIDNVLINVGVSESQVTQSCIYNPSVELPEGFILLEKHGSKALKNIWVYDAWWRLLRNMNIRSETQLEVYVNKKWPILISKMVKDLKAAPEFLLKNGVISKSLMSLSYLKNISSIN